MYSNLQDTFVHYKSFSAKLCQSKSREYKSCLFNIFCHYIVGLSISTRSKAHWNIVDMGQFLSTAVTDALVLYVADSTSRL